MQAIKLVAILAAAATEVLAEGATRRLVISIPDRKIALIEDGRVVKVYPVAVGKPGTPSPKGSFHIASHVQHPTWYQPGKVVGPGPANPLGTRWMGLGYRGYGIHGTNMPLSIGKAASHGCIRMRNRDVEELFNLVEVGDPVELTDAASPELAGAFTDQMPAKTEPVHADVLLAASAGGVQ
ncbi:MAG TPA: L,D-transpeptidase [Bryobacteraceae bacterium]|nr:L,D-transpeptidase [Bryobacteraceae bacterium]